MSGETVREIKVFWTDQDAKLEQWLRAMAAKGLHLSKVSNSWLWTFRQGAPADVAYRLDFNKNGGEPDYRQLIEDAGWELATEADDWQYWRKEIVDGKVPAIFTDNASRLNMHNRVQKHFAFWLFFYWFMLATGNDSILDNRFRLVGWFLVMVTALFAYAAIRLILRTRAIKRMDALD